MLKRHAISNNPGRQIFLSCFEDTFIGAISWRTNRQLCSKHHIMLSSVSATQGKLKLFTWRFSVWHKDEGFETVMTCSPELPSSWCANICPAKTIICQAACGKNTNKELPMSKQTERGHRQRCCSSRSEPTLMRVMLYWIVRITTKTSKPPRVISLMVLSLNQATFFMTCKIKCIFFMKIQLPNRKKLRWTQAPSFFVPALLFQWQRIDNWNEKKLTHDLVNCPVEHIVLTEDQQHDKRHVNVMWILLRRVVQNLQQRHDLWTIERHHQDDYTFHERSQNSGQVQKWRMTLTSWSMFVLDKMKLFTPWFLCRSKYNSSVVWSSLRVLQTASYNLV